MTTLESKSRQEIIEIAKKWLTEEQIAILDRKQRASIIFWINQAMTKKANQAVNNLKQF